MSDTFKTPLVPMTDQLVQSMYFLTIHSLHADDEGQEKESSLPLRLTPQSIPSGLNCPLITTNQLDFNSKAETTEALKSQISLPESQQTKQKET